MMRRFCFQENEKKLQQAEFFLFPSLEESESLLSGDAFPDAYLKNKHGVMMDCVMMLDYVKRARRRSRQTL